MAILRTLVSALLLASSALAKPLEKRATLQQITNSGISNPTNVGFYMYVPDKVATKPPVVVAIHYCSGTAQAYYTGTPYAQLADKYGFIVIYPSSPWSGTCWDVSSKATLTHNGGGDSNAIANMVTYTLNKYGGDASRVYVTGTSSGAMMTNVMIATYPEMFAAATAYSGVPAGCFVSQSGGQAAWNSTCAQGQVNDTPQQWANVVHNMYPTYTGSYPKFRVYHGSADTTLYPKNYNETVKEWCGVFGYSTTAQSITHNSPQANYETEVYGDKFVGVYATGVGHTVPVRGDDDMAWFSLDGTTPTAPATSAGTSATAPQPTTTAYIPPPSSTTAAVAGSTGAPVTSVGSVAQYGQCGGIGYTGATTCAGSLTCKKYSDYYSQCL